MLTDKDMTDFKKLHEDIVQWIRDWFEKNGKDCNAIIGLSGGKDSTIIAALCVEALGAERVIGVAMPDTGQGLNGAREIAEGLGISFIVAPIGSITGAFDRPMMVQFKDNHSELSDIYKRVTETYGMEAVTPEWSKQAEQNIPPRIRMTMLYAIAQTFNGRVACTCNLSEDWIGYATLYGDSAGSFAPFSNLTVTEIRNLGMEMGLKREWVYKVPDDGLPNSCPDEEKFGFSYDVLDKYIRTGVCEDDAVKAKIESMHEKNEFKTKILRIPSYYPDGIIL